MNVSSHGLAQEDVDTLKANTQWRERYIEGVRLAALAWGWDLDKGHRVESPAVGQKWTSWDVRLAKIVRSLWLFEEVRALIS